MSKCFIDSAGVGKTRQMLEVAKQHNATVVCRNPRAMATKAQNYGIYRLNIVGYENFADLVGVGNIVVDELADFFAEYAGVNLLSFTMTEEEA